MRTSDVKNVIYIFEVLVTVKGNVDNSQTGHECNVTYGDMWSYDVLSNVIYGKFNRKHSCSSFFLCVMLLM